MIYFNSSYEDSDQKRSVVAHACGVWRSKDNPHVTGSFTQMVYMLQTHVNANILQLFHAYE